MKLSPYKTALFLMFASVTASSSWAQSSTETQSSTAPQSTKQPAGAGGSDQTQRDRAIAVMSAATTSAPGSAGQFAPVVSVETTTKDKVVTAQLGVSYGDLVVTAGLSGAVDSSGDPTTLVDLNGLRDKTTATVNVSWHTWPEPYDTRALSAACALYNARVKPQLTDCSYLGVKRGTQAKIEDGTLTAAQGRRILRTLTEIPIAPLFYFGAGGKVAPETFNFVSSDTLTPGKETHTSWSANASGGVLFGSGWLLAGSYTREVAFHGGTAVQVCQPLGSTTALTCSQKTVGAPGAADSTNQVAAEVRKHFGAGLAISPRFTYDKHKNAVAIAAPLYFIKDADGGLDGGVTFGWRSDTKAYTVSAFVGAVLGLITK